MIFSYNIIDINLPVDFVLRLKTMVPEIDCFLQSFAGFGISQTSKDFIF